MKFCYCQLFLLWFVSRCSSDDEVKNVKRETFDHEKFELHNPLLKKFDDFVNFDNFKIYDPLPLYEKSEPYPAKFYDPPPIYQKSKLYKEKEYREEGYKVPQVSHGKDYYYGRELYSKDLPNVYEYGYGHHEPQNVHYVIQEEVHNSYHPKAVIRFGQKNHFLKISSPHGHEHEYKAYKPPSVYEHPKVYEYSKVYEPPVVYEHPKVYEYSKVYEPPAVYEHPKVYEHHKVYEPPVVYEHPKIYEHPKVHEPHSHSSLNHKFHNHHFHSGYKPTVYHSILPHVDEPHLYNSDFTKYPHKFFSSLYEHKFSDHINRGFGHGIFSDVYAKQYPHYH